MTNGGESFRTTRWSVVRAARTDGDPAAESALAELCEAYWVPLYGYARRSGCPAHEAEDLVQGFFARLVEKRDIGNATPTQGRFRSYLLGALRNFLANQRERENALKRGGGRTRLSIDAGDAESRLGFEPAAERTPEQEFERQWAMALIARVQERLAEEHAAKGKAEQFEALRGTLLGEAEEPTRRELAERLGTSAGALKVAIHRLRQRFGQVLREEVAETVGDPREVELELRSLFSILGRG